jgi:peptidoglycan-N-acetylglucosamine deacetylase
MPDGGEIPRTLDRETLRARREAARRRSRLARQRGLVVAAVALAALVVGVLVGGAAGGGRGRRAAAGGAGASDAEPGGGARHTAGSPANLDALVAAGKPVYCGAGRQRLVALTFDDGPGPYTKFAIDELTRAHARVTWFLVGRNLQPNAARLPQELALGDLGDHTWTHPALTGLSPDAATSEIQRTRDAVAAAAGRPVRLFRPPYGLRNGGIDDTVRRLGMADIIWSVDSLDSAGADKHGIARAVTRNLRPGAIVLMHENRGQTIQALHKILPAVRREHLEAVPVSELLARDPPTREQLDRGRAGCPRQVGPTSVGG